MGGKGRLAGARAFEIRCSVESLLQRSREKIFLSPPKNC